MKLQTITKSNKVICQYCLQPAKKVTGQDIYPHRVDLKDNVYWACSPCQAYVSSDPTTNKPIGLLANAKTRKLRVAVFQLLEKLVRLKLMTRYETQGWLASRINVPVAKCKLTQLDDIDLQQAIDECNKYITRMTGTPQERQVLSREDMRSRMKDLISTIE